MFKYFKDLSEAEILALAISNGDLRRSVSMNEPQPFRPRHSSRYTRRCHRAPGNQLGRNRSIDTPLLGAALQVIVGGVFVIGVVIGMA
jgi:hypothetical protein